MYGPYCSTQEMIESTYSDSEHEQSLRNFDLIKDFFFYYNYRSRMGKGTLDLYAGIYPRTVLGGDYTRAIFADDLIYYDPNLEGVTLKYEAPRLKAEITADIVGKRGIDRVGCEMISTAGAFKVVDWASLGWAASYAHSKGNYLAYCDTDVALFNPYVKVDFGSKSGIQELSLKAGAIASYQLDYSIINDEGAGDKVHFPMGAEAVLRVRNWDLGLENTFYYGDNQMVYRSSSYADICQMDICLLFKLVCYLSDGSANLSDVMDLSIQHSSCLMLLNSLSNNIKLVVIHIADSSNNTSGSDVESVNNLLICLF